MSMTYLLLKKLIENASEDFVNQLMIELSYLDYGNAFSDVIELAKAAKNKGCNNADFLAKEIFNQVAEQRGKDAAVELMKEYK